MSRHRETPRSCRERAGPAPNNNEATTAAGELGVGIGRPIRVRETVFVPRGFDFVAEHRDHHLTILADGMTWAGEINGRPETHETGLSPWLLVARAEQLGVGPVKPAPIDDHSVLLAPDIEGVLHPLDHDDWVLRPGCLQRLEPLLRDFESLRVVISSTWRRGIPWQEWRWLLAADVRDRVTGATPTDCDDLFRREQIEAFVAGPGRPRSWLAVDDDPDRFERGGMRSTKLVQALYHRGWDGRIDAQLRARLLQWGCAPV